MQIAIENPYKDITIHIKTIDKERKVCKKGKKKCKHAASTDRYKQYEKSLTKVSPSPTSIDLVLFLKDNELALPKKSYDARTQILSCPIDGVSLEVDSASYIEVYSGYKPTDKACGKYFAEDFILNGKQGHVAYTIEVESKNKSIKSLRVKVVKATLEDIEFAK